MKNLKQIIGTGMVLLGGLAGGCNEELAQGLSQSLVMTGAQSVIRREIEGPRSQPVTVVYAGDPQNNYTSEQNNYQNEAEKRKTLEIIQRVKEREAAEKRKTLEIIQRVKEREAAEKGIAYNTD